MEKTDKGSGPAVAASPLPMLGSRAQDDHEDGNPAQRSAESIARLVPMVLCVAALVVMLKNSETNEFGSISYSDLGAFRYLVHANGICAGYSLLSAIVAAMRRPYTMSQAWTFFFLDQVLTYLILAAGAVAAEVLYLEQKGDIAITWSAACGSFAGFCHKATASVITTFVAVVCYAVLSLISSYKLFSKYDAPVSYPSSKGIEVAAFHG